MNSKENTNRRVDSISDAPDRLYKYRSLRSEQERDWIVQSISCDHFYWASPIEFNDPFDCAPPFDLPDRHARRRMAERVARKQTTSLNRVDRRAEISRLRRIPAKLLKTNLPDARAFTRETAVYSMSEVDDDLLMWSHYADSHRGLCFVFDAQELCRQFPTTNPVQYQDERLSVRIGRDEPRDLLDKLLMTKSTHWRYEKEWRSIGYRQGAGLRRMPGSLVGVIFGALINSDHKKLVSNTIETSNNNIIEYESVLDERRFAVNIRAIK